MDRPLYDYIQPKLNDVQSNIRRPPNQAETFEIKPEFIHMIQKLHQFSGLPSKNPYDHLVQFLQLYDTFKYSGASDDAIRLRLFPLSLKDKARSWLYSFPSDYFTTWDVLANKFLHKYFPPAKTDRSN